MTWSIADFLVVPNLPENRFLEEMERVIPWKQIDRLLEQGLPAPLSGGRPAYPFNLLMRMTLLQWWHGLSDAQTEFQCADRMSFRRFLNLGLTDKVPDASTLEDFRHKLEAARLQIEILAMLEALLIEKGLLVNKGTLADASFVKAARPRQDKQQGKGRKGKGYNVSLSAERGTKWVRKVQVEPASVHDSQTLERVLPSKAGKTYVDLGYWGQPCQQAIAQAGGTRRIPYKKPKGQELAAWQKGLNKLQARIRCRVEHIFARWKGPFQVKNSRYQGLDKVNAYFNGLAVAYNLQRLGFLLRTKSCISWA